MKRLLAALLTTSFSLSAQADPGIRAIPPGEDRIVAVAEGQKAPFSGQLFDTNTAIRWGNWLEQYRLRLQIDHEAQVQVHQAQVNYLNQVLKIEQNKYKEVTEVQRDKILELEGQAAEGPPWYESFQTGMLIGGLTTIVVVGLSVAVVSTTSR